MTIRTLYGLFYALIVLMNNLQVSGNRNERGHMQPHKVNIFIWNVQGAGSRQFQNILREYIYRHRPSIMALVETRLSGLKAWQVCDRTGFRRSIRVETQGFQGGIWVLWHEEDIEIEVISIHEQFVTMGVKSEGQIGWYLTFIYASPHTHLREVLWQTLHNFAKLYTILQWTVEDPGFLQEILMKLSA